jgi:hypothetical protein
MENSKLKHCPGFALAFLLSEHRAVSVSSRGHCLSFEFRVLGYTVLAIAAIVSASST